MKQTRSDNRAILALALPAIVNNITVPLLGLCDTAIAGHLGSAAYIGAMSVGATMLNVIFWLCGFLRMGTSGLTAQAFGARNTPLTRDILLKSLTIGFVIAIMVIALQTPLLRLFIAVISPDPLVTDSASLYFRYGVWAAPAQLGIMAASGWFIGRQNTVLPMGVAIGVNVLNIALSLLFVFVWHLGFAGIALGTLCATWAGVVAILTVAFKSLRKEKDGVGKQGDTQHAGSPSQEKRIGWHRFFKVSSDLFFRSACIMAVTVAMTSVGARLGETTLAVNAVMTQFFLFFSYFMDGFAFAGEALVGKALGAADAAMIRRSVSGLLRWGAIMALLFFAVYFFFSTQITALLTDNSVVIESVEEMNVFLYTLPPITVAAFIFDGIFIGLTRTGWLLSTTLAAAALFFLSFFVTGSVEIPSNRLLWSAFDAYLLFRGLSLAAVYCKLRPARIL